MQKLREYIVDYISSDERMASDLYPLKKLLQHQKLIDRYDDFYSLDLFGETIEGHRNVNPYDTLVEEKVMLNKHIDEDRERLSKAPTVKAFEGLEGIE